MTYIRFIHISLDKDQAQQCQGKEEYPSYGERINIGI